MRVERTAAFNEDDVSDKPNYVHRAKLPARKLDKLELRRRCTLKAVDELVEAVRNALAAMGRLDNAYIFVLSDNGYLMGQHRLTGKGLPYEEASRVPMMARGPAFAPGTTDERLAATIDLAPTIAELAGVDPLLAVDGRSLLSGAARAAILLERLKRDRGREEGVSAGKIGRPSRSPSYWAVHTPSTVYVAYARGRGEFYDLAADPLQLDNLVDDPARAGEIALLAAWLDRLRGCAADNCRTAEDTIPSQPPAMLSPR
jgi:arylsulfatase A-like enzyme